eukprot:jgi/Picsp_1/5924/NSC_03281-R1_l-galactono- -lactone dehydrogenase
MRGKQWFRLVVAHVCPESSRQKEAWSTVTNSVRDILRHGRFHISSRNGNVAFYSTKSQGFKDPFVSFPAVHQPTAEEAAQISRRNAATFVLLMSGAGASYYFATNGGWGKGTSPDMLVDEHMINWSGTHECVAKKLYQPENDAQVRTIVSEAHAKREKVRCIGSALSPNGIGFQEQGMVSLAMMDKVLHVDEEKKQVTVQCGARVQDVADELRKHGLTLQNYASIREQTIGGFTQIGAHGSGAAIPPVDDTVVRMKMVTPGKGTIYVSDEENSDLFGLAKVGLGCFGVVTEVTLQCVPAHKLVEKTFTSDLKSVKRNHKQWLKEHKHLRYMWIPNTESIVVVQCNPEDSPHAASALEEAAIAAKGQGETKKLNPLQELLVSSDIVSSEEEVSILSPTECRDVLLAHDPLNPQWTAAVNQAEAAFWKQSEGVRVGWSDEILGFDCGGEQWVYEVAFPVGTLQSPNGSDIQYMEDLLKLVKKWNIPAPSPIEQRWTSGSSSSMSPASGESGALFSWVGIIMYLPDSKQEEKRAAVTRTFAHYRKLVEDKLLKKYRAVEHWAKIESPVTKQQEQQIRQRLEARYPIQEFQRARARLDPGNIMGNDLIDGLFAPSTKA